MVERPTKKNKSYTKRLLILGMKYPFWFYSTIIIAIILSFVSSIRPVYISNAVDIDIIKNKSYSNLSISIILIFSLLVAEGALQFLLMYTSNFIAEKVIKDLRVNLYKKLLNFKSSFFDKTPIGMIVTRLISDIETISMVFTDGFLVMFGDILKIIFIIFTMYYLSPELANISIMILPMMVIITYYFQKVVKKIFSNERNEVSNQNSFVQERLSGMNIIKIFNRQEKELENFITINKRLEKAYLKTVFYYSIFIPTLDIISGVTVGIIIFYSGYSTFHGIPISAGVIIAFASSYINMLVRPIRQIADRFNSIQRGIVGAERVLSLLDSDHSIKDDGTISIAKIKGNIEFENVYFSYNPNENNIIQNLNLKIDQGETVAIVGQTGAGKSTIINLINRFYEISSGKILLDGVNIKDFSLKNLRSNIGIVLQDVFLFNETILENIRLGNQNIRLDQVRKLAKEIEIDNFIMSLPNEYNYKIIGGNVFSLGQRQLISFLRALIYNPSILVLDEATSSIDEESERLIQNATNRITQNRTSIIIAHRLNTIINADKIIVLDHGKIVEMGTHKELIKNENGEYSKLYNKQFST